MGSMKELYGAFEDVQALEQQNKPIEALTQLVEIATKYELSFKELVKLYREFKGAQNV